MARKEINRLYYIAHIDNLPSIVRHGILSHNRIEAEQVPYQKIYDGQIVANRQNRHTPDGKSLWDFANLYFQPRNAMLYRVKHELTASKVVILEIDKRILQTDGAFIAVGNAASPDSEIVPVEAGMKKLQQIGKILDQEWWRPDDGSKRKMMAECLVPDQVEPAYIRSVYVASHKVAEHIKHTMPDVSVDIIPQPSLFFLPEHHYKITGTLSLVEGDMFFSQQQTLTVSVNVVGVMGKGLASRAKYQFPDVYVAYQDACRSKKLQMGKPFLYKREAALDYDLAEDPYSLRNVNETKWFLLFATKQHWREKSDIKGIEEGLQWVRANYANQDIRSLAMPALGCGLGGLAWHDVGPLMAKYLAHLDIPVSIYLPREKKIPDSELTPEFLLQCSS